MHYGNADLGGRERPGQCRVHVADDEKGVGLLGEKEFFERDHRLAGLHRVRSGANAQKPRWLWQVQI